MQTSAFAEAIEDLMARKSDRRTAIMCAEAVPWRCHRSLVADALIVRGVEIQDIMSEKQWKRHQLTPWARLEGFEITYPEPV